MPRILPVTRVSPSPSAPSSGGEEARENVLEIVAAGDYETSMLALALAFVVGAPSGAEAVDLVDAATVQPRWRIEMVYATAANFVGEPLYPVNRCLLRRAVVDKLVRAQLWLDAHAHGHFLVLKDCYRPASIQRRMFERVRDTPQRGYVSDPDVAPGGVHTYGAAVDVTLADADGNELDMGTPHDFMGRLAQPRYEDDFVRSGKLTAQQVQNRRLLRRAMVEGGDFRTIKNEWWHFDGWRAQALTTRYRQLDVALDSSIAGMRVPVEVTHEGEVRR